MSFGDNLRALIEERDITQKELAKKLNIAPSTLGSYVQNVREPICHVKCLQTSLIFYRLSIRPFSKECSTRQEMSCCEYSVL